MTIDGLRNKSPKICGDCRASAYGAGLQEFLTGSPWRGGGVDGTQISGLRNNLPLARSDGLRHGIRVLVISRFRVQVQVLNGVAKEIDCGITTKEI